MFNGLHYHSYANAPVAGWQGYLEDQTETVVAWIGADGRVVPHSDITGPP